MPIIGTSGGGCEGQFATQCFAGPEEAHWLDLSLEETALKSSD